MKESVYSFIRQGTLFEIVEPLAKVFPLIIILDMLGKVVPLIHSFASLSPVFQLTREGCSDVVPLCALQNALEVEVAFQFRLYAQQ